MEFRNKKLLELKGDFMAKKALVVDSSPVVRSAIGILLQRRGWEVIGAADGAEALMLASTWHFDLLITEPDPPKVSGLLLVRVVRWHLLTSAVRMILLVDEGQWVGEVAKFADEVLFKNNLLDKQLEHKLINLFDEAAPHQARRSFPRANTIMRAQFLLGSLKRVAEVQAH